MYLEICQIYAFVCGGTNYLHMKLFMYVLVIKNAHHNYFSSSFKCQQIMGVFHWSRRVSNYGFFEGREQCLQGQLGSVVVSWLVPVDRQNIKHV